MVGDFSATVEFLDGQRAVIVALFDHRGEWSGAGRVELRAGGRDELYEAGYTRASQCAAAKGGRLVRYSEARA